MSLLCPLNEIVRLGKQLSKQSDITKNTCYSVSKMYLHYWMYLAKCIKHNYNKSCNVQSWLRAELGSTTILLGSITAVDPSHKSCWGSCVSIVLQGICHTVDKARNVLVSLLIYLKSLMITIQIYVTKPFYILNVMVISNWFIYDWPTLQTHDTSHHATDELCAITYML